MLSIKVPFTESRVDSSYHLSQFDQLYECCAEFGNNDNIVSYTIPLFKEFLQIYT